jgi:alpha-N-arabinofuranosidase
MNQLLIHTDKPGGTINRNIYGHFAEHLGRCIYEGLWVGEESSIPNTRGIRNDVVAALKRLKIPVLRWPGGCFADEYHWKDGIGPREKRPKMINTHWGGTVENNHFGTHEFFDLCERLGCEAYICGNVGSGTPQEMMEWVEYMTSDADSPMANLRRQNGREKPWKVAYFGVGNESWGCGGNMRPEYYADEYRRFNTYVKNYGGHPIERIACGSHTDYFRWTDVLMENVGERMHGLSFHYYTSPRDIWLNKGAATGFDEAEWHLVLRKCLRIEELLGKHEAIMDKHDPEKKIGMIVDEWGTWYDVEPGTEPGWLYQQNSVRDALVAAISLHIFHAHHERVTMANIAQMVNVLQAMVLTDKDKMLLTPTYHVFEMLNVHQGATFLPAELQTDDYKMGDESVPAVHASASRDRDGKLHLSMVNLRAYETVTVKVKLGGQAPGVVTGRVLSGAAMDAVNTFESPDIVTPVTFTDFSAEDEWLVVELPARSVSVLQIE